MILMALGPYQFSIETAAPQEVSRTVEYRHEELPRLGRAAAMQFIGRGTETVTFRGVVFPHFRGGIFQPEALRRLAESGRPLPLVDGIGRVWGRYVVVSVEEVGEKFFANSAPRKQSFTLTLKAYGDDFAGTFGF